MTVEQLDAIRVILRSALPRRAEVTDWGDAGMIIDLDMVEVRLLPSALASLDDTVAAVERIARALDTAARGGVPDGVG